MTFRFDMLEPGLGISPEPETGDVFGELPFRAILNVCHFTEPGYAAGLPAGIRLLRCPFEDCWPVPRPWIERAVLELADLRKADVPTLIHCHAGAHRSPAVVVLYWMARDGISWDEAAQRVRQRHPFCSPDRLLVNCSVEQVVATTRDFLSGRDEILQRVRSEAAAITRVFDERPDNKEYKYSDVSHIEAGLFITRSLEPWANLGGTCDAVLVVRAHAAADLGSELPRNVPVVDVTVPPAEDVDRAVMASALGALDGWRREAKVVLVLGPEQDFFAVLTVILWVMQGKNWDVPTAIWYVGSRRRDFRPALEVLLELDLEAILADCRERGVFG